MQTVHKIEGHSDLQRRGAAIVNVDKSAFLEFLARREKAERDQERIQTLESEVSELKNLLNRLLETKNA